MTLTRAPRAAVIAALCTVGLTGCATSRAPAPQTRVRQPLAASRGAEATNSDERAAACVRAAESCADEGYVTRAFCYTEQGGGAQLHDFLTLIAGRCWPLSTRDPGHACLNDIERYETFLRGRPAPAAPSGSGGRASRRARAHLSVPPPCRQRRPRSDAPGGHSHPVTRLPRLPERLGRARQSRPRTAHQANAKLVFRVSVVRDASGSGLYLMKQHVRRPRQPLRRPKK